MSARPTRWDSCARSAGPSSPIHATSGRSSIASSPSAAVPHACVRPVNTDCTSSRMRQKPDRLPAAEALRTDARDRASMSPHVRPSRETRKRNKPAVDWWSPRCGKREGEADAAADILARFAPQAQQEPRVKLFLVCCSDTPCHRRGTPRGPVRPVKQSRWELLRFARNDNVSAHYWGRTWTSPSPPLRSFRL